MQKLIERLVVIRDKYGMMYEDYDDMAEAAQALRDLKASADAMAEALEVLLEDRNAPRFSAIEALAAYRENSPALRHWLWDNFGWELVDWGEDEIRF